MKDNKDIKLETTQFTQQEIWDAMKGNVHKSKKTYTRNSKHKGKDNGED